MREVCRTLLVQQSSGQDRTKLQRNRAPIHFFFQSSLKKLVKKKCVDSLESADNDTPNSSPSDD